MADFEERELGGLRIRIDRTLCVGFGDCVTGAPQVFHLADDGVVTFLASEGIDRQQLLDACEACPVDALTVWDAAGMQLVPS